MQALPWGDASFDVAAGFNSFFFAADLVAALAEAGRVTRPGGTVVIQVWGRPEHNDLEAMKVVARRYAPPPPPDAPAPPALWREGVLEDLAGAAGLEPRESFDVRYAITLPDAGTLGRELLSPMGLAALVGPEREAAVREEIAEAMSPFRTAAGGFRLASEFRVLLARA